MRGNENVWTLAKGPLSRDPFRWFFMGRMLSLFGSAMTPIALAFAVLQFRHGPQLLGYILAAQLLPHTLFLLVGGSVADRYRRDRLIMLGNMGAGLSQAAIAAVVLTDSDPAWIILLAIVNGVLEAFTGPAMRGIVPELVDVPEIKNANALLNAVRGVARMVGPIAGGMFVSTIGGGWAIVIDASSFFLSAVFMSRVHLPSHVVSHHDPIAIVVRQGWDTFRHSEWIWPLTGAWSIMNALQMGAWQVLGPLYAKDTFGATGWGVALSMRALGVFLGSLFMWRLRISYPLRTAMMAAAIMGLPMMVLGQGLSLSYLLGSVLMAGFGASVSDVLWNTTLQQRMPSEVLSRIMAFDDLGAYMLIPVGEIVAIPCANRWGLHPVEMVAGVAFMMTALTPLCLRQIRRMTVSAES